MRKFYLRRSLFRLIFLMFFFSCLILNSKKVDLTLRFGITIILNYFFLFIGTQKVWISEIGVTIFTPLKIWGRRRDFDFEQIEYVIPQIITLSAKIPSAIIFKFKNKRLKFSIEVKNNTEAKDICELLISKNVVIKPSKNNGFNSEINKIKILYNKKL